MAKAAVSATKPAARPRFLRPLGRGVSEPRPGRGRAGEHAVCPAGRHPGIRPTALTPRPETRTAWRLGSLREGLVLRLRALHRNEIRTTGAATRGTRESAASKAFRRCAQTPRDQTG